MRIPVFETTHNVEYSHIDNHGINRPSALFDFMQAAAAGHASHMDLDKDSLGIVWVLSRIRLCQRRPLLPGETLAQQTWCAGIRGVSWFRAFRFTCGGEEVAFAASSWVMLDPVSRRILRPAAVPQAAPYLTPPPEDFTPPSKLIRPELTPQFTHKVRYSDLDVNNHLNNVKIVDLIADGLALERAHGYFVADIQVNYTAECLCGEQVTLSAGDMPDGARAVYGHVDGADRFAAAVRLRACTPYA